MGSEPFRPDPADTVPPGERAALANTARHLVDERAELAKTAQELVKSNDELAKKVSGLDSAVRTNRKFTRWVAALYVIDVAAIITFGVLGTLYKSRSDCQEQVNQSFRIAIVERTVAANEERAAQRQLFDKVMNPNATPAERMAASQAYYAGLVAADKKRNDNPLPAIGACS